MTPVGNIINAIDRMMRVNQSEEELNKWSPPSEHFFIRLPNTFNQANYWKFKLDYISLWTHNRVVPIWLLWWKPQQTSPIQTQEAWVLSDTCRFWPRCSHLHSPAEPSRSSVLVTQWVERKNRGQRSGYPSHAHGFHSHSCTITVTDSAACLVRFTRLLCGEKIWRRYEIMMMNK